MTQMGDPSGNKERLDLLLVKKGLVESRHKAQALIMAGQVLVEDQPQLKPGTRVSADAPLRLKNDAPAFASRGGLKLAAALKDFKLDVNGLACLDVGASTGGFTDCLLQDGARHVYAVDVGYGQLAWKLRQDPRVTPIERTNIRYMKPDALPVPVDLITIDVSFISLKIVIPVVIKFLKPAGRIVALIKPQFEVGRDDVGKGGVVRDARLHERVAREISDFCESCGLSASEVVSSPVVGPKGNREFLICLQSRPTP